MVIAYHMHQIALAAYWSSSMQTKYVLTTAEVSPLARAGGHASRCTYDSAP